MDYINLRQGGDLSFLCNHHLSFYGNKTSVETHFYLVSGEKCECLNNETGWMVLLLNIDSSRSSSLKEGEKSGTLHQIFRECRIEFNIKNGLKVHYFLFSFRWKLRGFRKHFLGCYIFPLFVSWYIFLCFRHISQTCTEYSIQNVPFKYLCQRYILKSSIWVMLYNKLVNATFVFILLCF